MENIKLLLTLFDGEGDGSGEGTGEGEAVAAAQQEGDQAAAEPQEPEDLEKKFDELIKGEYKDIYKNRTQQIVKGRLGDYKALQAQVEASQPLFDMLAQRYGVAEPSDISSLLKAIEEDDSFYEDEAMKRGMSVQQYKEMKRLERNNEMLRRKEEEIEKRQIIEGWMTQAEELKSIYPEFDFETEFYADDREFAKLLSNGIDVETAYKVIHNDEILERERKRTAQEVKEKVANDIQARGRRPAENGNTSQAPASSKLDPSKMSKKEREELEKRALRGEHISF